jgi:hypothetical protein
MGELAGGLATTVVGEGRTALIGGLLCVAAVAGLARLQPGFARYDAHHPIP